MQSEKPNSTKELTKFISEIIMTARQDIIQADRLLELIEDSDMKYYRDICMEIKVLRFTMWQLAIKLS